MCSKYSMGYEDCEECLREYEGKIKRGKIINIFIDGHIVKICEKYWNSAHSCKNKSQFFSLPQKTFCLQISSN